MIFMSTTQTALFVGLVLGIVATFGGFGYFLVVLVFGADRPRRGSGAGREAGPPVADRPVQRQALR